MRKIPSEHMRLLNARGECIAALARSVRDARRALETAENIYDDVLGGTCYRCLGNGEISGNDFSPNITCPVCKGAKRWPEAPHD